MGKIILKILGWTFGTYAVLNTAAIVWVYWGHLCEESSNRMTVGEAENPAAELLVEDLEAARKWTRMAWYYLKGAFSQ